MKVAIFAVCLLVGVQARVMDGDMMAWEKFKADHGRSYIGEEHHFRFKIFVDNLRSIMRHNREYAEGKQSYKMAINQFTDMLHSEFLEKMTGAIESRQSKPEDVLRLGKVNAAASVDWRQKGAVTPVKDQGSCGSCWAFSATGALEGQRFLKIGGLVGMSEQNLVDCSWEYGNMGCGGGWMNQAFQYVQDNGGINTEDKYPYEARNGQCRYNAYDVAVRVTGYKDVSHNDESALKDALATVGPISVAINAGRPGFQFYSEGVYVDDSCDPRGLNHGVLAVGYGTENGQDYWLVKNSWGLTYGDQGYIKMARNRSNQCGIAAQASYPLVSN